MENCYPNLCNLSNYFIHNIKIIILFLSLVISIPHFQRGNMRTQSQCSVKFTLGKISVYTIYLKRRESGSSLIYSSKKYSFIIVPILFQVLF